MTSNETINISVFISVLLCHSIARHWLSCLTKRRCQSERESSFGTVQHVHCRMCLLNQWSVQTKEQRSFCRTRLSPVVWSWLDRDRLVVLTSGSRTNAKFGSRGYGQIRVTDE
jgi:hypothetical protein